MLTVRSLAIAAIIACVSAPAIAQSQLNVICPVQAEWCNLAAVEFVNAPVSALSPRIADIKLINYDFGKYGSSAERKRLLERWDKEVGSMAK